MKITALIITILFVVLGCYSATLPEGAPYTDDPTIVLIDSEEILKTHSKFLSILESQGHKLEYVVVDDDTTVKFSDYGVWKYGAAVILSTSEQFNLGDDDTELLLEFVDSGHSVFVVAAGKAGAPISEATREFLAECGADLDESESGAVDFFNKHKGSHTNIVAYDPKDLEDYKGLFPIIDFSKITAPIVFNGVVHSNAMENPLVIPLLYGSKYAFSMEELDELNDKEFIAEESHAMGKNALYVSAMQTRRSSRVAVCGSLEFLSNELAGDKFGNLEFVDQLLGWTFMRRGYLVHTGASHCRIDDSGDCVTQEIYRIKDEVEFAISVFEWRYEYSSWVPYLDEQLPMQFIMLDPYYRVYLEPVLEDGVFNGDYMKRLTLPDTYGVFKFVVEVHRIGYSFLTHSDVVSVRPFRHNEYERFIYSAYPWYAGTFSVMAAFFIFSFVFLNFRDSSKEKVE